MIPRDISSTFTLEINAEYDAFDQQRLLPLHHKGKNKNKKINFGYKLHLDSPKGCKLRKCEHFNNNNNKKDKAHHISSLTKSSKCILILFGISIAH